MMLITRMWMTHLSLPRRSRGRRRRGLGTRGLRKHVRGSVNGKTREAGCVCACLCARLRVCVYIPFLRIAL